MMDKEWVWLPRSSLEYQQKALHFVETAAKNLGFPSKMFCPCFDCRNVSHQDSDTIYEHLVIRGMDSKYKRKSHWNKHGDKAACVENVDLETTKDEASNLYRAAYFMDEDLVQPINFVEEVTAPRQHDQFMKSLEDAETPLYPGCPNYTKLSAIMSLYGLKGKSGLSDAHFNELLEVINDMLPKDNVLLKSLSSIKKFLKVFDMGYQKIHACENDCCLFRKEYKDLDNCPICHASRWKKNKRTNEIRYGIPVKVLRYFPIIPRFRRMFRSAKMAEDLRWHFSNKSTDGKMRHPVDSVTWEMIDNKWPSFSADPRSLRLGLATDGFNPFSMLSSKYSCWPVMLVTYNLPPTLCMKKENMMLTLLIPGPKQPGNDIDVYLQPLIEDLQKLWQDGVEAYDAFSNSTFNLKALLLWTINDFPAYGNMAGCCTKGKKACPICGKNTHHRWLRFSRKFVYMGHRKFLPPSHPYRRKKAWFDNNVEHGSKSRILTGRDISLALKDFPNEFGKGGNKKIRNNNEDVGDDELDTSDVDNQNELSRWKKRSILFDLPYWEELPLRQNLDVMHIEKNIGESLIGTMLNSGKSKDGVNARKDLEDMGIRKDLHLEQRGSRVYLPPAPHTFSKVEKKKFCKRLYDFKGPDGYCSNIRNCISLDTCQVMGLKSHDYHVLMQHLLPVALRGLLPKGPRNAIVRLCRFFSRLCQRTIDREKLLNLENEIIETLCQLERFFPPSFFDIMVHLTVHLAREARLCGPVHFRWMYPFERYMKTLKDYVRNFARPEGCIAEAYLAEECIAFCSEFLKKSMEVKEKENRNEDFSNNVILEGRPISKATSIILTDKEKDIAHRSVLLNTAIMDPFLDMHLEELQAKDRRLANNQTLLWNRHIEKIAEWTKNKIPISAKNHSTTLRWLAYGPRKTAQSFKGYIINGQRFHTKDVDRETQNSGVTYEAITMCRASAKDTSQVADMVTYYGILTDIILLDYHMFCVPVFKCHWANKGNGVKEEDGFTLVNLHQSQTSFARDPYILASQAKQVFYSREDDSSNWYVVMKAPPRGYHELETNDENAESLLPQEVEMDIEDSTETVSYVREDCEGYLCDL